MHKIQVAFGAATSDVPVPVRVVLDDHVLQGVSSVEVVLNDAGVTSVVLTLIASTVDLDIPRTRTMPGEKP